MGRGCNVRSGTLGRPKVGRTLRVPPNTDKEERSMLVGIIGLLVAIILIILILRLL